MTTLFPTEFAPSRRNNTALIEDAILIPFSGGGYFLRCLYVNPQSANQSVDETFF
jgi:hypothetical protein